MSGGSSRRYPLELRERAVRMVAEISDQHDSEWAAISEVARLNVTSESLRTHRFKSVATFEQGGRLATCKQSEVSVPVSLAR